MQQANHRGRASGLYFGGYMEVIKAFRKAGEFTRAAPLELCQITRERLTNWQRLPVEKMQAEIVRDIESLDRFEYLVTDRDQVVAMMVLDIDDNPHYGRFIYTRYAFSAEDQALAGGYKWMKEIAKTLNLNGYLITRQLSPNKIINKFKGLQ